LNVVAHITSGVLLALGLTAAGLATPIVPGLASSTLEPGLVGQVLIEELNCVACHASDAPLAGRSKKAPRLSAVGSRINPAYLRSFLRDPHGVKPGTTMPDVLAAFPEKERDRAAESLTHFLLSLRKNDFALQPPDAVAATHGERLFHSRGCVACHSPRDADGRELLTESSAPLGALDQKYSVKSLVEFLRRPHAVRPGGRMPDLRLQGRDPEQIAHYLLRETQVPGHLAYTLSRGQVWEGLESDNVEAERAGQVTDFSLESLDRVSHNIALEYEGWLRIAEAGTYRFHLVMNGGSLHVDGREVVRETPSNRRGVKKLQGTANLQPGWRKIALTYFHTGREPRFALEMEGPGFERGAIPSAMLSVSDSPIPAFAPLEVDAKLAATGRQHFEALGCASCHDDLKVPARPGPPLADLESDKGCLSEADGPWPRFHLNPRQRELIRKALPEVGRKPLSDAQLVAKTLVTFNCIACHQRDGLGGVAPERDPYFTGTHPELGNQGRIPPPLSHVGAKLTPEWMKDVMLHGKRQRPYLDASMPQYGEANIGHLVELFGKVDSLENVTFPAVSNIRESKNAGYEMMGNTGFACIACHDYNGQEGGAGALDLVNVTDRIQKSWFHLYMRNPGRFHPTVIMPTYWPGGQSIRPSILDGDTARQIEALWTYLEDGPRARKPKGLSRQSNEIRVSDVAEICRGRGTAGYRGIGVGYPERVNLAFDSEEMALRLLWKGEFASVNHGSFRARGSDRIAFPPGIPFHRLKSMDDNWPYKGKTNHTFPHDQGYQFRGYRLDEKRRPTFRYHYGDIAVQDFFEDMAEGDGKAWFRRTLRFDAPAAQEPFYFRAASGAKITGDAKRSFQADQLQLRITGGHDAVVRDGDPAELLIPLTLPEGQTTLTLEYRW